MIKNFTKDFQVKENSKFKIKDFSTTYKGKLNKEEGEKLDEAGRKIHDAVTSPETQQKMQDAGKQVGDFAARAAETVTKGVAGIFGAIGKAFDTVQKDLREIQNQPKAETPDEGAPKNDTDSKEGE